MTRNMRDKKRSKKAASTYKKINRARKRIERRHAYRNTLTNEQKTKVYNRYGAICYLCGKDGANTVDHVIPLIKGGTNGMKNLRPAHKECNDEKGDKIVILPEELEEIGW